MTITEVCEAVAARTGHKPGTQTVRSWIGRGLTRGIKNDGPVKLAARRVGGLWFIAPDDLERFLAQTA